MLLGYDHPLFELALLLIVWASRPLFVGSNVGFWFFERLAGFLT